MTDSRQAILDGENPKDKSFEFNFVATKVYNEIYVKNRTAGSDIPKEKLKDDLFVIFVEGKNDEKFWREFVHSERTEVFRTIQIPKPDNPKKKYAGKGEITLIFNRKKMEENSSNPLADKIQKNQWIGIIDRDFEQIGPDLTGDCISLYQPKKYRNLFVTDTNDIETFVVMFGGFEIYFSEFFYPTSEMNDKVKAVDELFKTGSLLGFAFKAIQNLKTSSIKPKFRDIDGMQFDDFCLVIHKKNYSCKIFRILLDNEERLAIEEVVIKEFIQNFIREKRSNPGKNFEDLLSACRGHSLMQVMCCYCSDEIKRDFRLHSRNSGFYEDKPETILFDMIFHIFKDRNSVQASKLYSSLRKWEQKKQKDFLKNE